MNNLNRRDFLVTLGMGATALAIDPAKATASPLPGAIKPISGSWFEFQHHATVEGVDWNPACARFTAAHHPGLSSPGGPLATIASEESHHGMGL